MSQATVSRFFLGANSRYGFYSLYDQFACNPKDHLSIIKGGPGTGKSTFMKRIGAAAEEKGHDVEYILCSGDPDSLDGVYIPSLHKAWVDGTSPHIIEPKHYGIDGSYVNLGSFCQNENLSSKNQVIRNTSTAHRLCYQKAYLYLESVGKLTDYSQKVSEEQITAVRKRAQSKIKRELHNCPILPSPPLKRFISAISYNGKLTLTSTLNSLCNRLCILSSSIGLEQIFFQEVLAEVNKQHLFYILCPSPLNPLQTEAILFPQLKLCFCIELSTSGFTGTIRTIHLDTSVENIEKAEIKTNEKLYREVMDAATLQLYRAKQYHDELESYYRPALDINALNAYTDSVIRSLFT